VTGLFHAGSTGLVQSVAILAQAACLRLNLLPAWMSGDSWLIPAILIVAAVVNGPWVRGPVAVPVAHESAPVSCDAELREQLELRDRLEWYRLALAALACLSLLLLGLLTVALCGCRCCAVCPSRRRTPASRAALAPKKGDSQVLALLAAQEVRR
jgi:hypothetical protein